jgi:hypothetical protein
LRMARKRITTILSWPKKPPAKKTSVITSILLLSSSLRFSSLPFLHYDLTPIAPTRRNQTLEPRNPPPPVLSALAAHHFRTNLLHLSLSHVDRVTKPGAAAAAASSIVAIACTLWKHDFDSRSPSPAALTSHIFEAHQSILDTRLSSKRVQN